MSSLYEISREYIDFQIAIENGEIPEEAIADTLAAIEGEFNQKIENTAMMIKNIIAEEKAIADEIKALQKRKKDKENLSARLKNGIYTFMTHLGKTNVETARAKVTIAKNPPSLKIDNEDAFKEWAIKNKLDDYLTFKEPELNKNAIKDAITSGKTFEGASLERGEGVRIK